MQFKLGGEALSTPAPDRLLETRFAYDAFGNLIQKSEAANFANDARTTDFRYDVVGRLVGTLGHGYYDPGAGKVEKSKPISETNARVSPSTMVGSASGMSTLSTICKGLAPKARAASMRP